MPSKYPTAKEGIGIVKTWDIKNLKPQAEFNRSLSPITARESWDPPMFMDNEKRG